MITLYHKAFYDAVSLPVIPAEAGIQAPSPPRRLDAGSGPA